MNEEIKGTALIIASHSYIRIRTAQRTQKRTVKRSSLSIPKSLVPRSKGYKGYKRFRDAE